MATALLLFLGLAGAYMHIHSSQHKGPVVGTVYELEFFVGTLLALACLPFAMTNLIG